MFVVKRNENEDNVNLKSNVYFCLEIFRFF